MFQIVLPGGYQVRGNPATNFLPQTTTLGTVISSALDVAIYIGGALMFFWAVWGVFDYIKAEGNKDALAKARKKIQWAIVGFVILLMSFFISSALEPILLQGGDAGGRILKPLSK